MSTATITGGKLELAGDGYGWASAVKTLPVAPSTTKRMVFAWRGWFDTFSHTASTHVVHSETPVMTDLQWLFGLRFSSTMPAGLGAISQTGTEWKAAYPDFFGLASWFQSSATAYTTRLTTYGGAEGAMAGPGIVHTLSYNWLGYFNAYYSAAKEQDDQMDVAGSKGNLFWPANPTTGATFTGVWDIYGSDVDNSVRVRRYINWDSVSTNDLFGALDNPGTWLGTTTNQDAELHGDITGTNWRNADGTMNFPRYLMLRYPYKAQKMVLDHYKVAYYDSV